MTYSNIQAYLRYADPSKIGCQQVLGVVVVAAGVGTCTWLGSLA